MVVIDAFPNSSEEPFIQTSHEDPSYNCIAWAAGDNTRWYWPDEYGIYYWPSEVSRENTVDNFIKLYEFLGYEKCDNGYYEENFTKVAVFSSGATPTHAARQLENGNWTSKLGVNIDVEHSIYSIENGLYGKVAQYLKKMQ
jgi:hypothetical protein